MKPQLLSAVNCDKNVLMQIKSKMDEFYNSVSDYNAFSTPSEQIHCWKHIANKIQQLKSDVRQVKILEIGAGRSGFGQYLLSQNLRQFCNWTAQDVTHQNEKWLNENADNTIFGDIEALSTDHIYDIVFSTFVFEHVVNPYAHLNCLVRLVSNAQGTIFIFCPRYDYPGYLTPSSKHLAILTRVKFLLYSLFSRIKSTFTGKPAFLIQTDLAAFYQPFFTDADAVHWASLIDLKCFAAQHKATFNILKIGNPKFFTKDWIVKRLLTVGISMQF